MALMLQFGLAAELHADGPALVGTWALNEDLSDDVEDVLDDKLRPLRSYPGSDRGAGRGEDHDSQDSGHDVSQQAYWDAVRENRERRSMKNLRRLGSAYPLLTATRLVITANQPGVDIVYDELLPRHVRPNPEGRIYSAKGDELVSDSLGFTLAYWEGGVLVMEIDPPNGGKFIERLSVPAHSGRLQYSIRLQHLALIEPVEITRVFDRVP